METCRALARDVLSCEPDLVKAYKGLINRGFAATLSEGRSMETELNREQQPGVSQSQLAAARTRVMARGREQTR